MRGTGRGPPAGHGAAQAGACAQRGEENSSPSSTRAVLTRRVGFLRPASVVSRAVCGRCRVAGRQPPQSAAAAAGATRAAAVAAGGDEGQRRMKLAALPTATRRHWAPLTQEQCAVAQAGGCNPPAER